MKTMSNNLKYFGGLTLVLSVAFFYYLVASLQAQDFGNIWLIALGFGLLLFASGLLFGYNDSMRGSRADLGFQYHLMTFIIVNLVGIPWLMVGLGTDSNNLINIAYQCVPWAIGLATHYYFSSKSIKGVSKEEIFD